MDNLIGLLSIRRTDRVPNVHIIALYEVAKGVHESVLRWFGHIEKMDNDRMYLKWR